MVATTEDLRAMSNEGFGYLVDRVRRLSQAGNANGLVNPRHSDLHSYRGSNENLRDRAVSRMNNRTSNWVHSREVNREAEGHLGSRLERSLYRR